MNWKEIFKIREELENLVIKFLESNDIKRAYVGIISKNILPEYYTPYYKLDKYYLLTSPELYLKKLIGIEKESFFSIGKVFRRENDLNTGIHLPEFEMVEYYKIGYNLDQFIHLTYELLKNVLEHFYIKKGILFYTWRELFNQIGIDLDLFAEKNRIDLVKKRDYLEENDNLSEIFYKIFYNEIYPTFKNKIVFVKNYPYFERALSKLNKNTNEALRFEVFWNQIEIINGYEEIDDCNELKTLLLEYNLKVSEPIEIDDEFIKLSTSVGLYSGASLGMDRLLKLILKETKDIDLDIKKLTFIDI